MTTPQLALEFALRPAMGADDFLVADSNREAVVWLDRWPDWPAPALTLYGAAGRGKTHLAHVWRARVAGAGGEVRFLSEGDLAAALPPDLLRGARACIVEAVDRHAAGVPAAEKALFHLYNHLAEIGGHVLLTAATPPARWPLTLADLGSRLKAAPAVALAAPDDALIAAVLVKLFADRQLRVGAEVVDYIVLRMERSLAAARVLVAALDRAALADRRNITVPLVREVLAAAAVEAQ